MKKWKVVIISVLVFCVVSFAAYIVFLISDDHSVVPGSPVEYHTKDELAELYRQNKDLLNSVKDSVLSSDSFMNAMNQERDGDIAINVKEDAQYFTKEEWATIVSVFEKINPAMIMMDRKGRPLIFYIVCGTQEQDSISKKTYLYWFPNEEERKYHEKPGVFPDGEFTQIDGDWYIVEATRTR
jgi:hypothetical protein